MDQKLNVGFIIDDLQFIPAWYFETIQQVQQNGFSIYLIYVNDAVRETQSGSFGLRLFQKFENKKFQSASDALKPVAIDESGVASLVRLGTTNSEGWKALKLDVIYSVDSYTGHAKKFSEYSRYGFWFISFGDSEKRAIAPGFWEVMKDQSLTTSILFALYNNKYYYAYTGTTRTVPYSVKNNYNSVAWKSSSFLPYRLEELYIKREGFFSNDLPFLQKPDPGFRTPGSLEMLFLFGRHLVRYLLFKIGEKFLKRRFTLLYAFADFDLNSFRKLRFKSLPLPDKNTFYADPFLIDKDGIIYIFFEEMCYREGKAFISVITKDGERKLSSPKKVLERPYHLSYPFVFVHEGNYYMIPETAANRTVELYRATEFPDRWEFVMNLMEDVEMIDVTLIHHSNTWWLFGNSRPHPITSTSDQLFLYSSKELFSKNWNPHIQNPVATHSENCRSAGRIFRKDEKLYRPAQNNASQQYGYGLKINVISFLSDDRFEEKEVLSILPETFGLKACHHLDFVNGVIVIDGIQE